MCLTTHSCNLFYLYSNTRAIPYGTLAVLLTVTPPTIRPCPYGHDLQAPSAAPTPFPPPYYPTQPTFPDSP